ncbi:MAG: response regulator [Rhodocyclaceae bacterium]|nr:response regulator [Rhodocyclaceae bacterium]
MKLPFHATLLPAALPIRLALAAAAGLLVALLLRAWLVPEILPEPIGALLLTLLPLLLPAFMLRALQRNLASASAFAAQLHLGPPPLRLRGSREESALCEALNQAADKQGARNRAALEGELRSRALLESALDGIISIDNGGRITEFNRAAEKIFGYRREEAIGQDMSTLLLPLPMMAQHIEAMQVYQEGRETRILDHRRTVTARRRNGSEFSVEVVVIASNVSGRREFTVWLRDMTEVREAADAMLKARVAAEDANRAKSDFLANMSHEIRTPLNAIIGITELALDSELNQEQREYLNLVRNSGETLLSIINELLDYARIEAGHLEFEHIEFSLRHTVAMAVRALAPKANEQRLELLINIGRDVPDALIGDPHRVRQILTNLIGNAIKFTPQGEIEVQVSQLPVQEDANVMLQFGVRDTGIGIPRDKLAVIFEAFTQVDTSTTRKFGGTGLGLAICTRLVEALGGRIWAESEPGRGSVFRFSARFERNVTASAPALPTSLAGIRVLVADTNRRHRALLGEQLSDWGMRARGVDSVAALLSELESAARCGLPMRIVLLDAGLLEVDGTQIIQRARSVLPPPALIVMQHVHMRRRSTDAEPYPGASGRLLKPLLADELLDGLLTAIGEGTVEERSKPALRKPTGKVGRSLNILLAEDNPINQTLALRMLEKLGHHAHVVANGQAAIDAIDARPYDVVLMDVQMPVMGGFEATAAIRAREAETGAHIPIVAMTAHAMAGDRERCLDAGMDDYVSKPIQSAVLDAALANAIGVSDEPSTEPGTDAMTSPTLFDRRALIESLGGDMELYGEIVRLFLSHYPQELDNLQHALAADDAEKLHRIAHSLKGAISNFSAPRATAAARTLEMALKGGMVDNAAELVQETVVAVRDLGEAMRVDLEEKV